jgi:hypothetical protein
MHRVRKALTRAKTEMIIALIERIDGEPGVPWRVAIHDEKIGALIMVCA